MGVLHIRDFPDDLQRDAHVEARYEDEPLRALVIRAVDREVERLRKARQRRGKG